MSNAASTPALSPAPNFSLPLPLCHLSCVPAFAVSQEEASFIASHRIGREAVRLVPCLARFLLFWGPHGLLWQLNAFF